MYVIVLFNYTFHLPQSIKINFNMKARIKRAMAYDDRRQSNGIFSSIFFHDPILAASANHIDSEYANKYSASNAIHHRRIIKASLMYDAHFALQSRVQFAPDKRRFDFASGRFRVRSSFFRMH